jgi:putative transposase
MVSVEQTRKELLPMAYSYSTGNFEKMLLQFMSEEDPMLSMLKWLCGQLMEAEVTAKVNAAKSERNSERSGYRSGYRVRRFDTRMGSLYLFVPKLRKGGYIPFFVTEKKRSEVALMNVIQEAYVNGVSTRKIEKLAKSLGIDSISRSQVSQITNDRHVKNMAVLVVIGVDESGRRDILAIEPMQNESEATYKELFQGLKDRGLKDTWLVVSDAHKGLVKAVQTSFIGCSWQRCKVHFMRNILAHLPAKGKAAFADRLKQIWLQPDLDSAKKYANALMDTYENHYPGAIEVLESGLEDSLQFYNFNRLDARKISSTNMLERLNREIRRRTSVVGIFPGMDSYIRLVTTYLIEYAEDWSSSGRCYIKPDIIQLSKEDRLQVA